MLKNEHAQENETRRERGKREKLERIEQAARRLFAEHGYDKTTTRMIADAAEIATGTLFVYFPEKLDLLIYLFRKDLGRIVFGELDALPDGMPVVDACMRVFDAVYDFYAQDLNLSRAFVKEMMFVSRERQERMVSLTMRYIMRLGQLVEDAKARGEVRGDVPAPLAGHQLFGQFYWGLVNWLAGMFTRRQVSMQVRMSLDLLMQGMKGGSQ